MTPNREAAYLTAFYSAPAIGCAIAQKWLWLIAASGVAGIALALLWAGRPKARKETEQK